MKLYCAKQYSNARLKSLALKSGVSSGGRRGRTGSAGIAVGTGK